MSDIKIDDYEIETLANNYLLLSITYTNWINKYIEQLNKLTNKGVKSGIVHDNLMLFKESTELQLKQFSEIAIGISKCCKTFLEAIDDADGKIYQ